MSDPIPSSDTPDIGRLQINITSQITSRPVADASISISYTGVPGEPLEQVTTDSSGQTELLELAAPPLEYSLNPENEIQPYSEYTLQIQAPGFEPVSIAGTEILADTTAIQNVQLSPLDTTGTEEEVFVIPAHTLYGTYPAKIPEDEIKPVNESGEIVLSRVVVPEYIVVHDGSPRDSTAKNYYVKYKDYIKNVAVKYTPHGRPIPSGQMCWQLCLLHLTECIRNGTGTKGMISPSPLLLRLTTSGYRSGISSNLSLSL
jgi:hypothetical protein